MGVRGEAVEVRGHVAGDAGVRVVPPGAAHLGGPLEHHDVVASGAAQGPDHREAREAGPHHHDVDDPHAGVPGADEETGCRELPPVVTVDAPVGVATR